MTTDVEEGGSVRSVDEEALAWALRMAEPDADWSAFTLWLEGDVDRSRRYDRVVHALEAVSSVVAEVPRAANDDVPIAAPAAGGFGVRGRWIGGAFAAALIGLVGVGALTDRGEPYEVRTAPGETRTVDLGDGSSVEVAGGSLVRLDRAEPRSAVVEAGEALFRVRHDARHPFRVRAGELRLTDLGTVFDVRLLEGSTRVAVAEGAVMVDAAGAALRLTPGQTADYGEGSLRRGSIDAGAVGGWSEGRLDYDGVTMAEVAEELSRHIGREISVAPGLDGRTFSGTLEIRALRDDPELLGALMGVRMRRSGSGWILEAER